MTPIVTSTNTAGEPIEVRVRPRTIAVTPPDGQTAYVGVWEEPGTVVPITTATNTPGQPVQVGGEPYAIASRPEPAILDLATMRCGPTCARRADRGRARR